MAKNNAHPYDASNPQAVEEKARQSKSRQQQRVLGLQLLMQSREGRAWMHFLLYEQCHIDADPFTGNSTTFHTSGAQNVGRVIEKEVQHFFFEEWILMHREARERAPAVSGAVTSDDGESNGA
ncbi:hypothetical protein [Paraburkholderia kururiensis]|uniref:hypothetical protein n=1 Tax=Paraburkholderia kururiensis TaxID=984307 RepID=UPI0003477D47|nr:hypothetical protein [Paraburkholderia kururiensis]